MSSNFIPMLSASPPPLDEGPSFDDDWGGDGDFGGFQSAVGAAGASLDSSHLQLNGEAGAGFRPISEAEHAAESEKAACQGNQEWPGANNKDASSSTSCSMSLQNSLNDSSLPPHTTMHISQQSYGQDSAIFSEGSMEEVRPPQDLKALSNKRTNRDTQDNTSQDSVTDSGLCSDISPVPKGDDYTDFVESKGDGEPDDAMFQSAESMTGSKTESLSLRDSGTEGQDEEDGDFDGVRSRTISGDDPLDLKLSSFVDDVEDEEEDECGEDTTFGQFSPTEMGYCLPDNFTTYREDDQSSEKLSGSTSPSSQPVSSEEERDSGSALEDFSTEEDSRTDTLNDKCLNEDDQYFEVPGTGDDLGWGADPSDSNSTSEHFSSGLSHIIPLAAPCLPGDSPAVPALEPPPCHSIPPSSSASGQTATAASCDTQKSESSDWLQDCLSDEEFGDFRGEEDADSMPPASNNLIVPSQSVLHDPTNMYSSHSPEPEDTDEFSGFIVAPADELQPSTKTPQRSTYAFPSKPTNVNDDDDDDDDDDDWAFKDAEDDDDDFGGFAEPVSSEGGFADFGSRGDAEQDGGDWAAFTEAEPVVPSSNTADDADDSEFQEFEDVTPVSATTTVLTALKGLEGSNRVTQLLEKCFPATDINGNICELSALLHLLTQEVKREQEQPPKQPGRNNPSARSRVIDVNVWNNLKDLEKTAALQYTWKSSSNHTHLLKALSIDTRNILMGHKKQAVPIFASGLGLLEPSRGPTEAGAKKEQPPTDLPIIACTAPAVPVQPAATPQDIPPAEFDWISSGLTNPLDSTNLQLDLDFFANKPSSGVATVVSPTAALENELLHAIAPPQSTQPKALQPLETILANMKFTPTAPPVVKEEKLGIEAGQVIGNFQELAFMRAKYLVFPIRGETE